MSEDPNPKRAGLRTLPISPVIVLALVAVVVISGGLGALAYRQHLINKNDDAAAPQAKEGPATVAPAKDAPGARYPAQFNTETMYPAFNPDRHRYVTRCVPGKVMVQANALEGSTVKIDAYPPETGRFAAEARPLPGQDFEIVTSTDGDRETYRVRCLAEDFPDWSYERLGDPPKGMFFVSFRPAPIQRQRNWAIVFDQDGMPVWWYSPPTNTLGGQVLADGTVQIPRGFGDGFGKDPRTGSEIRSLDGRLLKVVRTRNAPTDGHEYTPLPNGNALINSYKPRRDVDLGSVGGPKDAGVLDGELQEVTPTGKVVWRWNSGDHVPLSHTPERWWKQILNNPHPDFRGDDFYDIFHLNSADPWGDQIVISSRHTDKVLGIDKKTGRIDWTFGGEPDPKSLKVIGGDPRADFPIGGNHDARISRGNILSVHDNSTNLDRPPRAVRYRINLKNRTATYVGQNVDPLVTGSHCCGGVRPFGTGWLVAWGNTRLIDGFDSGDRLAFRMRVPIPVYRAVPVPEQVNGERLNRAMDRMEPEPPLSGVPVNPIQRFDE